MLYIKLNIICLDSMCKFTKRQISTFKQSFIQDPENDAKKGKTKNDFY